MISYGNPTCRFCGNTYNIVRQANHERDCTGTLCNTCSKANVSCPIYPQATKTCCEYKNKDGLEDYVPSKPIYLKNYKGIKMTSDIHIPERPVPASAFVALIAKNVHNTNLDDKAFRELISNTLSIVEYDGCNIKTGSGVIG
jgi:hypothetical protein